MSIFIFFCLSVLCMILGHIFKVKRWKQLIAVYEETDEYPLMTAMGWGHLINAVCPVRIGYLFRMIWGGKHLKMGYAISIATVFADLYVDVITVGTMACVWAVAGPKNAELTRMARNYQVALVLLVICSLLAVVLKKYIKKGIKKVSSVFNEKIQYYMLYQTYLSISSVKDIVQKINIGYFLEYTVLMWGGYIFSYSLMAKVVSLLGYSYTTSDIFTILFSGKPIVLLENQLMMVLLGYLCVPLVVCLLLFYGIHRMKPVEAEHYRNPLPQVNVSDKLSFLKKYYEDENRDIIHSYLEINQDVAVVEDRSAGSNACTSLVMNKDGKMFFRKYAYREDGKKLQEQIDWIEAHQKTLPLPLVSKKTSTGNYVTYDMPYYSSAVGLFRYAHTVPLDLSWRILETALEDIKNNCHSLNVRPSDKETIYQYIDTKIYHNMKMIKEGDRYIRGLEEFDSVIVNGRELHTLKYYSSMLEREHLYNIFKEDVYSDIHGDLTIENIVCISDNEELEKEEYQGKNIPAKYYYIDPNTGNLHDSPMLDLGKLLQSLHGNYEFLMVVASVSIRKNVVDYMMMRSDIYDQLYKKYYSYLTSSYTREQVLSIYYHEVVHWFRLMPYKIRKNEKLAVVFYTELLKVLHDVWELENEQREIGAI